MRVLVACEFSGVVRDAFRARGHDAWSNDLEGIDPQGEWCGNHLYGDVREILEPYGPWDLIIAHPPCTFLSVSGLHRTVRGERPLQATLDALEFVQAIIEYPSPKMCIENPVGFLNRALRKPDQIIQPYEFGDDASKKTCLWLRGLPLLVKTKRIHGRIVNGKERFANQTDSGQNRLPPSKERASLRSVTYPGIAAAMAEQWG